MDKHVLVSASRALAEQVAKEFLDLPYDEVLPARAVYDRLLLTAHLRVGS